MSVTGRRRDRLARLEWGGIALGVGGALAVALLSPLAADAVLAYSLTVLAGTVAYRGGSRVALIAVPVALVAYRGALDLAFRASPSTLFAVASVALFAGGTLAAGAAGLLKKEDRAPHRPRALLNCVDYDVFALIVAKDIARCQRYRSNGALALIHPRNLEALTKPDAYQQHDLVVSHVLAVLNSNIRRSDTVCYLGDLHFVIAFPHTNSEQAWTALARLHGLLAPLPQRLCPALSTGPLDWEAVCLEYPGDAATAGELLQTAARTLGRGAEQRIDHLEKRRAVIQRQLQKLGYV